MRTSLLFACFLLALSGLQAQNLRRFEIEDFDRWNTIKSAKLSADGAWAAYVLQPDQGDPVLILRGNNTPYERRIERADDFSFSADSRFLVYRIHPPIDSTNAMRRRRVSKTKLPPDTLAVLSLQPENLPAQAPKLIPHVKNYQLPVKWAGWLAYGIKTPLPDSLSKKLDKESYRLVFLNLNTQDSLAIDAVKAYAHAEEGPAFMYYTAGRDSAQAAGLYYFDPPTHTIDTMLAGKGDFRSFSFSKSGHRAAFIADQDTTKTRIRPFVLYAWEKSNPQQARRIAQNEGNWRISEHAPLSFSHLGDRLYFGKAPLPVLADTSLLEEEIVQVEVWTTQDKRLYTQEEVRLDRERKRAYTAVYHFKNGTTAALHDSTAAELLLANRGDAPFALAYDETPYLIQTQWEGTPSFKDLYLVDLTNGSRKPIAKAIHGEPRWSPGGNFVYWYSPIDTAWMAYCRADGQLRQLTNNRISIFYDEQTDIPDYPEPHGLAAWEEADKALYLYDRYDWWRIDPMGIAKPQRLTRSRESMQRLRYIQLDPEQRFLIPNTKVLVHSGNEQTYHEGYAWLNLANGQLEWLQTGPFSYTTQVQKARQAEVYLYTRENFQEFPDLRVSADLKREAIISSANPWQQEYAWGTIEHYEWISLDGTPLKGLLLKPAGFDPQKKYPLIVNFYERNAETIYEHRPLFPHRSQINYPFYLSRGYVIFNPDIPYRDGYPGESAYNAIMPGVTGLINEGFVDAQRIGIQGHSWGGYQIAYLLTRTQLFRCAEAGAPVVNMVSAYGGIRWESGLSRQFQYEHTQSRIGGSLWKYPLRFLENSPIFTTDKINTPVLILHNDNDGAVPWYQSIEWFTALRRLGKPAWLLNYNDEPHWPVKRQNRIDLQRRMSQFFDHYLMDGPVPPWMVSGVSPMHKGILQGY